MTPYYNLLEKLIAFETVSHQSNLDLIDFCQDFLTHLGFDCLRVMDDSGQKAGLLAGYNTSVSWGGFVLSAHSDVVPVAGQNWSYPPFQLTKKDNRFYGRGTADMKGFLAAMLYFASLIAGKSTKEPVFLSISYDEEIGCVGVRPLLDMMQQRQIQPRACLVGEPTSMRVAVGHKGKIAAHIVATGYSAHSALAPHALNAIYLLIDFINRLRQIQEQIMENGQRDTAYDVPYTTLHAGIIQAGLALNIVPDKARAQFEIRNIYADRALDVVERLRLEAAEIVKIHQQQFAQTALDIDVYNHYPALETAASSPFVQEMQHLAQDEAVPIKVAYGTEAGLFAEKLNCPVVVCGPGSMAQGHKPDEFIEITQLELCAAMMHRLSNALVS